MTEYIVSQEQFETIARAVLKNIDRPITEVVVGADKLPEIVRCRDCKYCDEEHYGAWGRVWHCEKFGDVEPDGFCAWGIRKEQNGL